MAKNLKEVEFSRVVTTFEFDVLSNKVYVTKLHYSDETSVPINTESHMYDLRTTPLSLALQLASAIVGQVGLVDYE